MLSGGQGRMRVMRRGQADAVEFREMDGMWVSESGAAVEIGAVIPSMEAGYSAGFEGMRLGGRVPLDRFGPVRAN